MTIINYQDRIKQVGVLYIDLYPYRIHNDQLEFLILKRNTGLELSETWQAISGKIKKEEKISQAFWRQALEKTGITPNKIFKIDYVSTFYDDYYDTVMMVPVAACEMPHAEKVQLSELHIDYKWVNALEVNEHLIWPNQKQSISLIQSMLKSGITKFHDIKKV